MLKVLSSRNLVNEGLLMWPSQREKWNIWQERPQQTRMELQRRQYKPQLWLATPSATVVGVNMSAAWAEKLYKDQKK